MQEFTEIIMGLIKSIPKGKVATYGGLAQYAGRPRAARQVSRILHTCSDRYQLPWHRVINAQGRISLAGDQGRLQRKKLETEGVIFSSDDTIDLSQFAWSDLIESNPNNYKQ